MSVTNDDQKAFWETFANIWVENQDALDGLMAPVLDAVLDRADLRSGQSVLDIGCGTGTSTIRAAQAVGPEGHAVGADISEPMLRRARAQGAGHANLSFLAADVADHAFAASGFDRVISRFGVMFFADPEAAFANVRHAMKPGARLAMACWSGLDGNPWFRVPMYAAKARLGAPPKVDPDAPGPLAFRDIERVRGILRNAGFGQIDAEERHLLLTPPGSLRDVAEQASSIGPAARAIEHFGASRDDFDAIASAVAADFAGYSTAEGVRVPAAINIYTATAPDA